MRRTCLRTRRRTRPRRDRIRTHPNPPVCRSSRPTLAGPRSEFLSMPLSSLFQRFRQVAASGRVAAPGAVHVSPSDVEAARVRARRRLIGMVVLVGAGVVGFPWLFETQPRPMSHDVEMVQAPSGEGEDGLSVARGASRTASGKVAVAGIVPPAGRGAERSAERPAERADEPREEISSRPPAGSAEQGRAPVAKPADKPAEKKEKAEKPAKAEKVAERPAKPADKPATKAPDKAEAKPDNTRYVVQFGAFADAGAARAAREKVERLGIKTYAQQIDTPAGKRIRVRVGHYADKTDADKALATLRKAGLSGAVLTL